MKHFTYDEFDSPDIPNSGRNMDPHFLEMLDAIREEAGIPMVVNSGYRTAAYNRSLKDSTPNSAHTRGMAADIRATTGKDKFLILRAAIVHGIKRIGIGKNFLHLDCDSTLPNPTIWFY